MGTILRILYNEIIYALEPNEIALLITQLQDYLKSIKYNEEE